MSKAVLAYVNKQLAEAGINYEFGEWKSEIVYPYWVGEYNESPPSEEDCSKEATLILTGWTTGKWVDLENDREKIEKTFTFNTAILDGSAVSVSYAGGLVVPTGDATLKRMQINLSIKEWRVI